MAKLASALRSVLRAEVFRSGVGRKIEIGSVMQLSGKRDAALPAPASPRQCRSDSGPSWQPPNALISKIIWALCSHPKPWGSLPCRFQTRQNCRCCRSMQYLTTVQAIALRTACLAALAACANSPSAQEQISSRDSRSQAYCFIRADQAGSSDYDVAGTCERAERVAKARSQTTHIDAELDRFCDEEATYGGTGGPFSWRAYMRCVDTSI